MSLVLEAHSISMVVGLNAKAMQGLALVQKIGRFYEHRTSSHSGQVVNTRQRWDTKYASDASDASDAILLLTTY